MALTSSPSAYYGLGISLAAIAIVIPVIQFIIGTFRPRNYPPGPKVLPGLGNLHQIPLHAPFIRFHEWRADYGDVIGLKVGPNNLIILNTADAVHDLLSRRGATYSGRPYAYIPQELVFYGHADKHILSINEGPFLRWVRATLSPVTNVKNHQGSLVVQDAVSTRLARGILDLKKPSEGGNGFAFADLTKRWALEAPLLVLSGHRIEESEDGFVARFFELLAVWLALLEPGKTPPVDIFPFLRWVPEMLASWKTNARRVRAYYEAEYSRYLGSARRLLDRRGLRKGNSELGKKGSPVEFQSIATKVLEKNEAEDDPEKRITDAQIQYAVGVTIDAAVVTTWATTQSMILHMAALPDVQAKAREEIDRVCGDEMPGPDSIHQLPYLQACLLELLRMKPTAPLNLPREVMQDDNYRGYHIPKGATVLANVYALGHDPDAFENPYTYNPERFIRDPNGMKDNATVSEGARKATYAFGAGRRICTGEQFARNSILLTFAKFLWAFDIVPAEGEKLDLSLEGGYIVALDVRPKPFNVEFKLRSEARRKALISGAQDATDVIDDLFG